jgi:HlyD family type I secretion membrane fusion protein
VAGAVITSGTLRPVSQRVAVLAGSTGLLRSWPLVEGQAIRAGDVLATLDDPDTLAQRDAMIEAEAGERLRVERLRRLANWTPDQRAAPPALPAVLGQSPTLHAEEARLLATSWQQQHVAIEQIDRQQREAATRVSALELAAAADEAALALARDELQRNEQLASDGFVSDTRLLSLRRSVKEAESRLQAQRGALGEALDRREELSGQRRSEPLRLSRDNARDLADAERRLADLVVRRRAAESRWQKLTVTAQVDGRVVDLRPLGPGSVVGAGQALLDILPADTRLRVQARLRPADLAEVSIGAAAEVRITAFPSRETPLLPARVVLVGADRSGGPDAAVASAPGPDTAPFVVWLELAPTQLPLVAGMDAEVFIATRTRTPLDYWLSPLTRLLRLAGRER